MLILLHWYSPLGTPCTLLVLPAHREVLSAISTSCSHMQCSVLYSWYSVLTHLDHTDDWQGFFRAKFELQTVWELWKGRKFLRNTRSEPNRATTSTSISFFPVYSLWRSSRTTIVADATAAVDGGVGGGCLCIYRQDHADAEPFGMWFCWLVEAGSFVMVDLQNSVVSTSLADALIPLEWDQPPRNEVFFARFKKEYDVV